MLKRGFALVRDEDDQPLTSVAALSSGMAVSLQFHDGRARALVDGGSAAPEAQGNEAGKAGNAAVTRQGFRRRAACHAACRPA